MSPLAAPLLLAVAAALLASSSGAPSNILFPGEVEEAAPRLHRHRRPASRPPQRNIYFPDEEVETGRPAVLPDNPPERPTGQSTQPAVTPEELHIPHRPAVRPERPRHRPEHTPGGSDRPAVTPDHPAVTPGHPATRPGHGTDRRPAVVPDSPPPRPGLVFPDPPPTPGSPPHRPEVSGETSVGSGGSGSGSNSSASSSSSVGNGSSSSTSSGSGSGSSSGGSGCSSSSSSGSGSGSSSSSSSGGSGSSSSSGGGGSSSSSSSSGGGGSSSSSSSGGGSGASSSAQARVPDEERIPIPIPSCGGELFYGYDNVTDKCRKLWTDCEPGSWFVVHPDTGEAGCRPRPCPAGETLFGDKCWTTSGVHSGACAAGMGVFLDHFGHGFCDCLARQVYWPEERRCYPAYRRGPCPAGQHLVVSEAARRAVCQPAPCPDGEVLWRDAERSAPAGCFSTPEWREDDPCPAGGQLIIDIHTLQVACEQVALHAVFDPPQVRCPAGSFLDFTGECRDELEQKFRSSFAVRRASAGFAAGLPGFTATAGGHSKSDGPGADC